jgi:hypothetical protein
MGRRGWIIAIVVAAVGAVVLTAVLTNGGDSQED